MIFSGRYFLLVLVLLTSALEIFAQAPRSVHDLQRDWHVYEDGSYRPFSRKDNGNASTIYFLLDNDEYSSEFLRLRSAFELALFVNGKLAVNSERPELLLRIDSLKRVFHSSTLQIAIHQEKIHTESLLTDVVSKKPAATIATDEEAPRPPTYFRDFVLVGSLLLLIMLVVVIRLNTKLAGDYFSVSRIFSLRESDDSQLYGRITSSSNILFYSYCSLIVSFYLMIIFHFVPARFQLAWPFQTYSFFTSLWQWLKLSFFLFAGFFAKIMLIYLFTRLFALQEIFGLHVFNWIRLLLIFFGFLLCLVVAYHITHGYAEKVYSAFLWCVLWISLLWTGIIFPKVMRRSGYSLFHIFSYICATEIIPVLISLKIIYY